MIGVVTGGLLITGSGLFFNDGSDHVFTGAIFSSNVNKHLRRHLVVSLRSSFGDLGESYPQSRTACLEFC